MINVRAVMAMIASGINDTEDEVYYRDYLAMIETNADRTALILTMTDGTRFKIAPEVM